MARRVLEDHRRIARVRPLPASHVIRLMLSSSAGSGTGSLRIEWDGPRYRETVTSAGVTTIRGIQGGRAYATDEDGVTRVVSEPVLSELLTRSYFFRRAWLFDDAERAKLALGPADPERVSVRLTPRGGDPLLLTFERRGLRLAAASSAGLDLSFVSPERWRDASRPGAPVEVDLRNESLPTGIFTDASVGGWSSQWPSASVDAPIASAEEGSAIVRGSIAGQAAAIAVDASVDGPVRVRPALAARLGLAFAGDVFGRRIAPGARLEIGGWSEPHVHVQISDAIPGGADASVGGALFRECVVEFDGSGRRIRFHDPEKWVRGEGYYRCVLDDDGNRPVAILQRRGVRTRAIAGVPAPRPLALTPLAASRMGFPHGSGSADGLHWGPAPLPPLPFDEAPEEPGSFVEGRLSTGFLLRFRALLDMPHRWAYLKPESGPTPPPD